MITRPQQILIKRAQREAGLSDDEYRDALDTTSGCRSTKDPKLTDRGVDLVLAYLEAIYFRKLDQGLLQPSCSPDAVFRQRGHWKAKNCGGKTSRDRFIESDLGCTIADLEASLAGLGFAASYCAAIRSKVMGHRTDTSAQYRYKAALERTLRSKQKKLVQADNAPF